MRTIQVTEKRPRKRPYCTGVFVICNTKHNIT